MLTVPTDTLYKFFAVGGLAMLIFGATYPVQRYEDAELKRVDAVEKYQRFHDAHGRFAREQNEWIAIWNDKIVKGNLPLDEQIKWLDEILSHRPALKSLRREGEDALIEARKQVEIALHYQFMSRLWLVIGACCVVVGAIGSYWGFSKWRRQARNEHWKPKPLR